MPDTLAPPVAAEHLDVLIVGAGISGIDAAYHLQKRCPGKSWAILEAREAGHDDLCLYFACPDVDGTAALLGACGLAVEGPETASYGMCQATLRDPDGYQLCFQARARPSATK